MSKINKIANEGIQYDVGGSGDDNIRFAKFDGGFLLLKKVRPDIVAVFLTSSSSNDYHERSASGDFAGFEGYTKMALRGTASNHAVPAELTVSSKYISIEFGYNSPYVDYGTSCAGIYRVGSTK